MRVAAGRMGMRRLTHSHSYDGSKDTHITQTRVTPLGIETWPGRANRVWSGPSLLDGRGPESQRESSRETE